MAEERVQRRLVAILAADVAGYSRLMGEDEEAIGPRSFIVTSLGFDVLGSSAPRTRSSHRS